MEVVVCVFCGLLHFGSLLEDGVRAWMCLQVGGLVLVRIFF